MPAHIGILGSFVVGLAATVATIAIHGVASMSVSLRPRRGLPSSTAQPRPITECWRIHQTNFRHISKAPPEPRRTVRVGECPSFSGFSQLYTVLHLNLAYRWFCRLGLDADVPDHSTFSKNRHGRFRESDPPSTRACPRPAILARPGAFPPPASKRPSWGNCASPPASSPSSRPSQIEA
jgi:hypothetical protein